MDKLDYLVILEEKGRRFFNAGKTKERTEKQATDSTNTASNNLSYSIFNEDKKSKGS